MPEQASTLPTELFGLEGQVAVVTGGTGVLGRAMARGLARAGAKVGVLGRRRERAEAAAQTIEAEGGEALALPADVLDRGQLEAAREVVLERWGRLDVLVNAAGGNMPSATLEPEQSFFDLPVEGMEPVIALNLEGTLLPSQVFGEVMARRAGPGRQHLLDGRAAGYDSRGRLRSREGRGRERHPLARGGARALVR